MDEYQRMQRGRRRGRVCPCCGDPGSKADQNRAARARLARDTRRAVDAATAGGDQ